MARAASKTKPASGSRKKKVVDPPAFIIPVEADNIVQEGAEEEDNSNQDNSEDKSNWWTCPKCKNQLKHFHDGSSLCHKCYGRYLRTDQINLTGLNPRKHFDDTELAELQASIKEYGILEPLIVRPAAQGMFDLVAGERRFRSACNLQLGLVPVEILDLDDQQVQDIMLIENIQRSQLGPMEEAWAIRDRLSQGDIAQAELAGKLGKTQPWLANRLRLLQAPMDLQEMIISREITPKHVILLLKYTKYPVYKEIYAELKEKTARDGNVSVKTLESLINNKIEYGKETFDLEDLSYEYRELKSYLDLTNCTKCSDFVIINKYGKKNRFCLNKACWQKLVNQAKKKLDDAFEKELERLKKKTAVDLKKLPYDRYNKLKYANFDTKACVNCDNKQFSTEKEAVCLDPKCFKKKNNAKEKQKQQKIRDEAAVCWAAVDEFLDRVPDLENIPDSGMNKEILRTMVRIFGIAIWGETARKGLNRWGKVPTSQYTDEYKAFLASIPDKDLDKVMIRLMVAVRFTQGSCGGTSNGPNIETLKEILPAAAPYYKAPEAAK
ncbi:ParB/RepB/Spo0J family partition protein [Methanosarcina sp. T3]|uniref:ParB/RepB/Spo0J family partition protein n=1 Tax=Methanosarcina sp. T3 TaxID=3439062 RepID=UPI003F841DB3